MTLQEFILANPTTPCKVAAERFSTTTKKIIYLKAKLGIRTRIFTPNAIKEMIRDKMENGISIEEVAKEYKIPEMTILNWKVKKPEIEYVKVNKWSKQEGEGFFNVNEFENWII